MRDIFGQFIRSMPGEVIAVSEELRKAAQVVAQTAIERCDIVPRHEFDAQTLVLAETRRKVDVLESEFAQLSQLLEKLITSNKGAADELDN